MDEQQVKRKLEKVWEQSATAPNAAIQKEASWKKFSTEKFPKQKSYQFYYGTAASILIIVAVTAGVLYQKTNLFSGSSTLSQTIIHNPTQQLKIVYLPDSSKVELATNAQLSFSQNFNTHRNVKLTGEAVFEVQKDKVHPFTVESQQTTTTVLGTVFRIKNPAPNHTEVSLYEGSVQLQVEGRAQNWWIAPGETFVATQNQVAVHDFSLYKEFHEAPLSDFVSYIQENYGYQIKVEAPIDDQKITLKIERREQLSYILEVISKLYHYRYNIHNQIIYFTPKN
ncbi:FecR family protein [Mesonia aestuariivivens]|uniref:FecR family protein n=1 Tax=Mesonia aestuariivivens TaxID=2796128 RepID=A0ABS6W525_9FLAO|nr:FecR family protein [Mesonia aestuariivivens]MBW2962967.1 FecR family protein [Mesonia aestuariivivens]